MISKGTLLGKHYSKFIVGGLIALFMGVSLFFRIALPYDQVFVGEWVKLTGIDAYFHVRLVDILVHNFPHLTYFDPYFIYPDGRFVVGMHFFVWLLSGITWVVGLGSPSAHTVDMVCVYLPPVLAALTVIPIYFIGKTLFGRGVGIIAAGLVAVIPGEFLGRSILGFTDQHIAEVLFSTVAIMFLVIAIKGNQTLSTRRLFVYSVLAGIFLGIYLITWMGGLIFVFIFSTYLIVQFVINHLRGVPSGYLVRISVPMLVVALIFYSRVLVPKELFWAMILATLLPLVLFGMSYITKSLKPIYYPLGLSGLGIAALGVFYAISPNTVGLVLANFSIFNPSGASAATTVEMQPLFSPVGTFTVGLAWTYFTTTLYLVPIAFIVLLWAFVKNKEPNWLLFIIWMLVILMATVAQRRFAYYLAINMALLSAYISWQLIRLFSIIGKTRGKHKQAGYLGMALAVIVVFFAVFYPNMCQTKETASHINYAPSDAWQSSLLWMRDNTPEPLDNAEAYDDFIKKPKVREERLNYTYTYPETAYGVTAWWDYGYWITRIAHRIPSVNPSQSSEPIIKVANLFLSQDNGNGIMEELDSSYLILDYAITTSKFHALIKWAGREADEFAGIYYIPHEGELVPVELYYPAYYRSLCVRVYNFNGMGVTNERPIVITYVEETTTNGNRYKRIVDYKELPDYQDAVNYVIEQGESNHRVVGINQFISPIDLGEMPEYRLIYSSQYGVAHPEVGVIPEVKIFEYVG